MASLDSQPQALDPFAESLSSFGQVETIGSEQPDAAVQSAAEPVKMTQVATPQVMPDSDDDDDEEDGILHRLEDFYKENQMLVLCALGAGLGYYIYSKRKK